MGDFHIEEEQEFLPLQLQELRLLQANKEGGGREGKFDSMAAEKLPLSLDELERIVGYNFRDQRLLRQAFTHASVREDGSYERLEYVGDSVLNLLIASDDYFEYPDLPPGKLTRLRAANVDTEKLARVAVKHSLHRFLRHRKPLLDGQILDFMDAIKEYPLHSNGLIDPPKVLADIVESTIGAIYIDSNSSMDTTRKVVKNLLEPVITPSTLQIHPVTKLYEFCQKHGLNLELKDFWEKTGTIECFVDDEFVERGTYHAKKEIAINRAANQAYDKIVKDYLGTEEKSDDPPK